MWMEHKEWVQEAIRYMEFHLKEDVEFEDVVQHTAVSRFHFHRIFKEHVGISASAYLRERRLTLAAMELLSTNKRILDISLEYRFAGQDSFSRAFKRQYQMTPQQYRSGFRVFQRTQKEVGSYMSTNEYEAGMGQNYNDYVEQQEMQKVQSKLPVGWMFTGVFPNQYQAELDRLVVHRGTVSATVKGLVNANSQGFGTLMQMFKAKKYQGKRLRLTGFLKTKEAQMAGLWMRVDSKNEEPLAFDNMMNRPVMGTKDWAQHDVVLDIDPLAEAIAFGVILSGEGQVWVDGIRIEEVDHSVPVTDSFVNEDHTLPEDPLNLDFEMIRGEEA
ncbi:helix-turn-helix transcriptional regulator [Paenibacillus arenosi]|uniref:Helix-turn-helix transcriptional regulator n=1 Tax=Paenibacillus arenosi TaxID=2774142 RepID=A0ABR9B259_9BACL|nr:AraC family transcriptional regulator [Paenibacillus arenosi]MBD8500455.1 helix-turn-helix transcriptional regulator [Paenibacillus arenosi]